MTRKRARDRLSSSCLRRRTLRQRGQWIEEGRETEESDSDSDREYLFDWEHSSRSASQNKQDRIQNLKCRLSNGAVVSGTASDTPFDALPGSSREQLITDDSDSRSD
ncbi:unnamed protein product [Toxocara canis]|uniref:DCAF7 n=1 Tax=Toxocara canis TaxID=6265 RepID=A0A183V0L8_TOXCA|nr:unnamed protein product [Toxocara canis]